MDLTRSIVVGYDDTSASAAAVRWAAALARSTGVGLRIVHAWSWPLLGSGLAGVPVMDSAGPRNQAMQLLDAAAEAIAAREPDVQVHTDLLPGTARDVLDQISQTTEMLVVGTRGLGPVLSTLLGSVSRGILHDAGCPVAVIRSEQHTAGPVLVAADGSPSAAEAVEVAADLASSWAVPLRIVHVRPDGPGRSGGGTGAIDARTRSLLDGASAQALAAHDGLTVETRVLEGRSAADGLLTAAAGARILVMGHRGHSHGPLGSTVHATVLHATGNVVVVRRHLAE
ncbi:universal stress protein [Brachybacterium alimentarium]|uniref:Universal stress protein UspA n=1 Tax=Brachybacterium alimentarium TaxID=47845 RepID=A0A2A3YJA1_9MICO|nr:universal stress protein [Brachybacterium alimentarium]PCC33455.1 universal stress protein UspA [Brachybacterium alimentarium]PCC39822.1 universal stress protein UspA [Brachybacterium alimentarium]RCS77377.1 universal stress protein [Brachybacterium alimentarium]RCS83682.1 universal stress protein [Brachybacterium alimentarium]RCS85208.1 universal stress protein [Brachybacterium alimentarium]